MWWFCEHLVEVCDGIIVDCSHALKSVSACQHHIPYDLTEEKSISSLTLVQRVTAG